jgi:phosphatidylinositol alpha-1,6-mannosyltransferase
LRILIVSNDFPPRIGGIDEYVAQLASRLPGDEVTIFAPAMSGCERFDGGFPHRVVRWPGRILLPTPPVRRRVLDLARTLEPDIVLFGASMPLALLGPVVRRRLGVPYAACTHGLEIAAARLPGGRALLRRMFRDAALVTAVSRWTADILRPFLVGDTPLALLPAGIDVARFRPDVSAREVLQRHRLDGGGPIIACVSRLVMRKGQDQVIRALPRVAREFPGVRFLVVGSGPDGDRLRALTARLRVSDRVVFAGAVDAADLPAYFRAGDVFAMPCRHRLLGLEVEALGAVFLQAAGVARPSVAGRVGGVPDAVEDGDTGLLVDGTSVQQVGDAILALLRDPERTRAMGIRGADRVHACFSWESMAGRLRSALADAVATAAGRPAR